MQFFKSSTTEDWERPGEGNILDPPPFHNSPRYRLYYYKQRMQVILGLWCMLLISRLFENWIFVRKFAKCDLLYSSFVHSGKPAFRRMNTKLHYSDILFASARVDLVLRFNLLPC